MIWLWGVWKLMHQQLLRRRRKKGELLERTLIGALALQAKGVVVLGEEKDGEVVVSTIFYFHPYLGKIPILTNIFQMG